MDCRLLLAVLLIRRRKNQRGYLNTGSPRTSETMRFLGSDTDLSTSASRTSGQYPFYTHSSNSSVSLSNYTDVRSSSPAPPLRPSTPNSEQVFYPSSPRKVLASSVGASNSGRSVARDVVRSFGEEEPETRHVRIRSYDGPLPISSHSPVSIFVHCAQLHLIRFCSELIKVDASRGANGQCNNQIRSFCRIDF